MLSATRLASHEVPAWVLSLLTLFSRAGRIMVCFGMLGDLQHVGLLFIVFRAWLCGRQPCLVVLVLRRPGPQSQDPAGATPADGQELCRSGRKQSA